MSQETETVPERVTRLLAYAAYAMSDGSKREQVRFDGSAAELEEAESVFRAHAPQWFKTWHSAIRGNQRLWLRMTVADLLPERAGALAGQGMHAFLKEMRAKKTKGAPA